MHACKHAYMYTCIHACMHAYIHTYYMHMYAAYACHPLDFVFSSYLHAMVHRMHTFMTFMHTCMHATYMHACYIHIDYTHMYAAYACHPFFCVYFISTCEGAPLCTCIAVLYKSNLLGAFEHVYPSTSRTLLPTTDRNSQKSAP